MEIKRGGRGVSPVIATVLLIALVLVMGTIIFLWAKNIVVEGGQKNGQNVATVCEQVNFDTTYQDGLLTVSNMGNIPIFRVKVEMYKNNGFQTKDITELTSSWASVGLKASGVFSGSIGDVSGVSKIVIIPVLLATSGHGSVTHTCDATYGKDILPLQGTF